MRVRTSFAGRHHPSVDAALAQHGSSREVVLPILQTLQGANGALPAEVLGAAADGLKMADSHLYGVASFYSLLSTRAHAAADRTIRVCDSPICMLHGAEQARRALEAAAPAAGWTISRSSCLGLCDCAPAALVGGQPAGPLNKMGTGALACADSRRVWESEREAVPILLEPLSVIPSYAEPVPGEARRMLARVGRIDPDSIDSALAEGAYGALGKALAGSPGDLVQAVEAAKVRGCGGAGFPTARKWRSTAACDAPCKYVIANADESEPGAFKDRVLMQGDPHLLLEGMALAGYAVGADRGIIYIRGEYEWIAARLERAIGQARERGRLGRDIAGSHFSFEIDVHRGAGAYICGEETALLDSLEGRRGEPRLRPPYPATHGYLGQPTVVNNVETLCQIPSLVEHGHEWYKSLGTTDSPGTKLFTITGHVNRCCACEAPLGITLGELVRTFGGGMRGQSRFKMALTGGAAGMIVPESLLDVPLDFAAEESGVLLGSGAMLILDQSVSAVTLLSWIVRFFEVESCGKCTPCREGTQEVRAMLERIANGRGQAGDLARLQVLADMLASTSLCGLGRSVAWPIRSALAYFAADFAALGAR